MVRWVCALWAAVVCLSQSFIIHNRAPVRYRLAACERRKASASLIQCFSVRYL